MFDIKLNTFLRVNGDFVDFVFFDGPIDDEDYIEGAIELSIDGVVFFDKTLYDYVDQLWCYLSQGLYSIYQGKDFNCNFPDQPIRVDFKLARSLPNSLLISINSNHIKQKILVDKNIFLKKLSEHCIVFLEKMKKINPDHSIGYEMEIEKLRKILCPVQPSRQ